MGNEGQLVNVMAFLITHKGMLETFELQTDGCRVDIHAYNSADIQHSECSRLTAPGDDIHHNALFMRMVPGTLYEMTTTRESDGAELQRVGVVLTTNVGLVAVTGKSLTDYENIKDQHGQQYLNTAPGKVLSEDETQILIGFLTNAKQQAEVMEQIAQQENQPTQ